MDYIILLVSAACKYNGSFPVADMSQRGTWKL